MSGVNNATNLRVSAPEIFAPERVAMVLSYPIAKNAREALKGPWRGDTLNSAEVRRLLGACGQLSLKCDFLNLDGDKASTVAGCIEAGIASGFIQRYGGGSNERVLAVTYCTVSADGQWSNETGSA
jgi:hypothetical protein